MCRKKRAIYILNQIGSVATIEASNYYYALSAYNPAHQASDYKGKPLSTDNHKHISCRL